MSTWTPTARLAAGQWDCPSCGNPYDLQWVEGTLIARVNERVRAAQLDDLRCGKCRRVKTGHMVEGRRKLTVYV